MTVTGIGSVKQGDGEIHSDDHTWVEVSYNLFPNGNAIVASLTVTAKEANGDYSFADTVLVMTDKVKLASYDSKPKLAGRWETSIAKGHWFEGECHDYRSFPSFGALSDIQVAFDAPGDEDARAMKLKAKVKCKAKVLVKQH